MEYIMTLTLRDKNGDILKSTYFTLDTEYDIACDIGIGINHPAETELISKVEDISVSIRKRKLKTVRSNTDDACSLPCVTCDVTIPDAQFCCGMPYCDNYLETHEHSMEAED